MAMYLSPFATKRRQVIGQVALNNAQGLFGETKIDPEDWRTAGTAQFEDSFAIRIHDVYVAGSVIIGIDDNPIAQEPQNSSHGIRKPKLVGLFG
jgi:hypothetical protein